MRDGMFIGVGKTTSVIVLVTELAEGTQVIMIDADPAKRLTRWSMLLTLPKSLRVIISQGERFIQDEISDAQSKALRAA